LSAAARGEPAAQAAPSASNGTVEARAVEQAQAAAANGDVRNNYSAQRALASYEAMSQVGTNASARATQPEQPTAPGQRGAGVLRT
jgi:S-DNA-T family DNA segregation ATPase FtsK/SpoIIIE